MCYEGYHIPIIVEDYDFPTVVVYTNGSCIDNGCPQAQAGCGVFWGDDDDLNFAGKLLGSQTNNRAEAAAVLTALKQSEGFHGILDLRTDSKYVVHSINVWSARWKKNGWKNAKGQPVANQDIFKEILYYIAARPGWVHISHVPANAGEYGLLMASRLARLASSSSMGSCEST